MIRHIFLVISILVINFGVVGHHFQMDSIQQQRSVNTDFYNWKAELVDSFEIPEPAINMALNGF
ncbi:MAG: hypothetical protein R6V23_15715, partial [Bacteroidales bacterium]